MKQYLLKVWMTAALSLLVVGGVWGQESYTPDYPKVSDVTHESAKLKVSASVGGVSFDSDTGTPIPEYYSCYVVLPSNQNPPTIVQVFSGKDSNSVPVDIKFQGKIGLWVPDREYSESISGLAADTEYVVYLVTTEGDFQTVVIETTESPTAVPFTTKAAPLTLDLQVPEDGASDVALSASLVATFNQNIHLGSGAEVHIYDYQSESLVETITTELSLSGSDLIINPTSDLAEGTHYYVVIPNGAVETTSGAPFAGLSDKDAWDFTTVYLPLENPVLSPAHNDDGVLKDVVLSLEFDKDIELGSGNIEIYSDGVEVRVLTKNSSSVSIVNNNTLQIDLSNNPLPEYETVYDVRIASTLIKRVGSDVYFVGFDAGEWSFTTEVQPDPVLMTTSSLSPADGDVEVSRAPTLQVSFDQEITWGPSGVLTIRRSDNDATAATISREQTGASISQDQLSIVFSSESLEYGTEYYVIIDEGFVKALNTSAVFPGLSDKTFWTFTTETAPPFWKEGYPSITNQTIDGFVFNAWADQEGVFYGVVTLNSSPPTVEDIEQPLNGSARISFNEAVNDITIPTSIQVPFDLNTALGNTYFLHTVYKAGGKYSEVATLQVDRVVPEVLSSNPAEGTIVFPVTESIEILFSEEVVGIDGNPFDASHFPFELKDETIPVDFSFSLVTESEMTKVVLTPTTALIEDTIYTITISEVYDLSGNPFDPVSITFETDGVSTWTGGNSSNWL